MVIVTLIPVHKPFGNWNMYRAAQNGVYSQHGGQLSDAIWPAALNCVRVKTLNIKQTFDTDTRPPHNCAAKTLGLFGCYIYKMTMNVSCIPARWVFIWLWAPIIITCKRTIQINLSFYTRIFTEGPNNNLVQFFDSLCFHRVLLGFSSSPDTTRYRY